MDKVILNRKMANEGIFKQEKSLVWRISESFRSPLFEIFNVKRDSEMAY